MMFSRLVGSLLGCSGRDGSAVLRGGMTACEASTYALKSTAITNRLPEMINVILSHFGQCVILPPIVLELLCRTPEAPGKFPHESRLTALLKVRDPQCHDADRKQVADGCDALRKQVIGD